jgi:uncharacterized membrane protein YfcA
MKAVILAVLGAFALVFLAVFVSDGLRKRALFSGKSWVSLLGVGFVTNFFDTLGIGSFAPTTAAFKFFRLVDDRIIPGTLNVGHTLPVAAQALIFITAIEVERLTLAALMTAALLGAVLGAGIVSRLPVRKVRLGMGAALLAVALSMLAGQLHVFPSGGTASGLAGWKLAVASAVVSLLGALSTIGVGFYAPTMALVYALGMDPRLSFPLMMGSCAFLMTGAGARFVREGAYDRKAAAGLTIGGLPGVFLAAFLVVSLPLTVLKWVVITVILFTSAAMFQAARATDRRVPTGV